MYSLLTVLLLFAGTAAPAQEVKLGEKVPGDLVIKNIINYPKSEIRMSDLKGKLVIFDFGTTSCAPCIKLLPELDSLQKAFGDKIQVFFVIPEDKARGQKFLQTNPNVKGVRIPVITGDSVIRKLFPHVFEPFECWVDGENTFIARTQKDYINYQNIDDVVNNRPVKFIMHYDEPYDHAAPLMVLNNNNIPEIKSGAKKPSVMYSAISTYLDGVAPGGNFSDDSVNNTTKFSMVNRSIQNLYLDVLGYGIPPSHVFVEVGDPSRIEYKNSYGYRSVWERNNYYCFESVLPLSLSKERLRMKRFQELDTYFSLHGRLENRDMDCWIVQPNGEAGLSTFLATAKKKTDMPKALDLKRNVSIDLLVGRLNWNVPGSVPASNETFFDDFVSHEYVMPDVNAEDDFKTMKEKLHRYGLDLVKGKRKIEMFVISDAQN